MQQSYDVLHYILDFARGKSISSKDFPNVAVIVRQNESWSVWWGLGFIKQVAERLSMLESL